METPTHLLKCSHAFNSRSRYDYFMKCIILKEMPHDRLKILVFGERYWKFKEHKSHIRYIDSNRVKPIKV